jgi:hypothetical protein
VSRYEDTDFICWDEEVLVMVMVSVKVMFRVMGRVMGRVIVKIMERVKSKFIVMVAVVDQVRFMERVEMKTAIVYTGKLRPMSLSWEESSYNSWSLSRSWSRPRLWTWSWSWIWSSSWRGNT